MDIFPTGESWIANLTPLIREEVMASMSFRNYCHGEIIYSHHDECNALFQVERGQVKLSHTSPDGKEMVYTIMDSKACFGEMGLIDGVPRMTDAVAEGATRLHVLNKIDFDTLRKKHIEITDTLLLFVARRLRLSFSLIQEVAFFSLRQRLARRIHVFAQTYGEITNNQTEFTNTLSQEEFGKLLGSSRQSINKEMKNLQDLGLIIINGHKICIPDMEKLQAEFGDLVRYE